MSPAKKRLSHSQCIFALCVIPVLVLALLWVRSHGDSADQGDAQDEDQYSESLLSEIRERWADPEPPEAMDDFPSEEALLSLRTMWDHRTAVSEVDGGFQLDDFRLDDSVEIAPDFDEVFDEPLSEGTGHVARISWTGPESLYANRGGLPDQLVTHAVYFDDGAPAILSAHQVPENDTLGGTD